MTRHAEIRAFDHRSIPSAIIDALLDFGQFEWAGNGCEKVHFNKRSWRLLQRHFGPTAKAMDHYRDAYLIIANDGMIVTVGWMQ